MQHLFNGQVWEYDDEVVIGPLSYIRNPYTSYEDDEMIDLWAQMLQVGMSLVIKIDAASMTISRATWDVILVWAERGFSDLTLHDYLNRMLALKPVKA